MSYEYLLQKALDAARRPDSRHAMSTGEQLAVAMILNKHDWLMDWGYTIAEAIDRVEPSWVAMLRRAEREVKEIRHQELMAAGRN